MLMFLKSHQTFITLLLSLAHLFQERIYNPDWSSCLKYLKLEVFVVWVWSFCFIKMVRYLGKGTQFLTQFISYILYTHSLKIILNKYFLMYLSLTETYDIRSDIQLSFFAVMLMLKSIVF